MRRALDEFVIEGIKTTIPFHRQLMDDPRYIAGIILLLLWIRLK
jgi:acetyl-CoA carboxylase biotin carboxylase subunit